MQNQLAYNTLSSVIQYLIWMQDQKTELDYDNRDAAMDIIRAAKKELGWDDIDVRLAHQYSDKWEYIYHYGRAIKSDIREKIRPILGYF